MLANDPFYFGSVRKVVVAFGSLFSQVHIVRQDSYGNPAQTIQVPLSYGPKEKYYIRLKQQPMPNVNDQVEIVLPRMSYEVKGFIYDETRKLSSVGTTTRKLTTGNAPYQMQANPVPYNIQFDLNIMVRTVEDGLMIIEQILPFFTPDYTVTVNDIPQLQLEKDIPIVLHGMTTEDTWDGDFKERRTIAYILSFTAKAYIYPPINMNKIILDAKMNFYFAEDTAPVATVESVVDPITATEDENYTVDTTYTEQGLTSYILPLQANLNPNTTYQFALYGGPSTLTLTPQVGSVNSTGLYTAPTSLAEPIAVVLRNTLISDPSKWSESFIILSSS